MKTVQQITQEWNQTFQERRKKTVKVTVERRRSLETITDVAIRHIESLDNPHVPKDEIIKALKSLKVD